MGTAIRRRQRTTCRLVALLVAVVAMLAGAPAAHASEANLILPDLHQAKFGPVSGYTLLLVGMIVCVAGFYFGLSIYRHLRDLPVHKSMLEVSELIYETCKTYLRTQGKFILVLWVFIAAIMVVYFGFLQSGHEATTRLAKITTAGLTQFSTPTRVAIILLFSLIGIGGSYFVAAFGIRINTCLLYTSDA